MDWSLFHFLRPFWLLLMPVALLLTFVPIRRLVSSWDQVIAPHLLPYLLVGQEKKSKRSRSVFVPLSLILLSLGLAGPTFLRLPSEQSYERKPLIICLEVSPHMLAQDVQPTRLKRALYKLEDLLKRYQGAEVALIAFAGDAHVVVPLTNDYQTLLNLAKSLSVELMPIAGNKISSALELAKTITNRRQQAHILVVTSTNNDDSSESLDVALKDSVATSFLVMATPTGAPLPSAEGRFTTAPNREIKISRLEPDFIKYVHSKSIKTISVSSDTKDIDAIISDLSGTAYAGKSKNIFDEWLDMGPYLLGLSMVVMLLGFFLEKERFWLFGLLLFFPSPRAEAGFTDWFLNKDQQAERLLQAGDANAAAQLFEDDMRKGLAYYRAKDYGKAIEHLSKVNSSDGFYNLGNALAQAGKPKEAVASYEQALKLDATNQDAKTNKELLEKLLKEQEQKQQQESSDKSENKEQKPSSESENKQDNEQSPNKDNENQNKSQSEQDKKEQSGNKQDEQPKDQQQDQTQKEREPKGASEQKEQPKASEPKKADPASQEQAPTQKLDKESQYYLDRLNEKENNNLYLRNKFRYESNKKSGGQ